MPRLLTITFTTAVFWAEAAYGSLKPPPTRRLRRALLHLSYSTTISRLLDTTRSSNRTCRFPASGSRKRRTPSRTRHVTPSATSEHKPGAARLIVNPHVLCCFLRSSLPEVPSLHRRYPASLVVRTSPPPHMSQPLSLRRGQSIRLRSPAWSFRIASGLLCLPAIAIIPAGPRELVRSSVLLVRRPFLCNSQGGSGKLLFRDLLSVHSRHDLTL